MMFRASLLLALFAAAFAARARLDRPQKVTSAAPLAGFPMVLDEWRGQDVLLAVDVLTVAAVDDHLNRQYQTRGAALGLYIGYYRSQRQGEALHSPLFCLPGSGWQPIRNDPTNVRMGPDEKTVNSLIVERGLDRLLVLYWYQTFARVTASEYARKLFLMRDAFVAGRTDVALVRLTTPIIGRDVGSEKEALDRIHPFAELVLPEVQQRLFRP